jgi:hypothetical protein
LLAQCFLGLVRCPPAQQLLGYSCGNKAGVSRFRYWKACTKGTRIEDEKKYDGDKATILLSRPMYGKAATLTNQGGAGVVGNAIHRVGNGWCRMSAVGIYGINLDNAIIRTQAVPQTIYFCQLFLDCRPPPGPHHRQTNISIWRATADITYEQHEFHVRIQHPYHRGDNHTGDQQRWAVPSLSRCDTLL